MAADIPGLIEGAADGVGLGHDFLRHVSAAACCCMWWMYLAAKGGTQKEDFAAINAELQRFSPQLAAREQLVLGNKCDIASEEQIARFRAFVEGQGLAFFAHFGGGPHRPLPGCPAWCTSACATCPGGNLSAGVCAPAGGRGPARLYGAQGGRARV